MDITVHLSAPDNWQLTKLLNNNKEEEETKISLLNGREMRKWMIPMYVLETREIEYVKEEQQNTIDILLLYHMSDYQ